jgi:cell division protein FtsW
MIFTILCEELGFIGAVCTLLLFALFTWRTFSLALRSESTFSKLVALGIGCKVGIQVLLNVAVVTNTIPNTGISLPFFSYGGSSLLMLFAEMGILLSISRKTAQNN